MMRKRGVGVGSLRDPRFCSPRKGRTELAEPEKYFQFLENSEFSTASLPHGAGNERKNSGKIVLKTIGGRENFNMDKKIFRKSRDWYPRHWTDFGKFVENENNFIGNCAVKRDTRLFSRQSRTNCHYKEKNCIERNASTTAAP